MNPQIRHAQRACEAAKARQAVVVWFDEHGQFAVASHGETKAECSAIKPLCDAVADGIDPNGNYEPSNCRWATQKEQSRNMRQNLTIKLDGQVIRPATAAEAAGLRYMTVFYRIKAGWDPRRALETPTVKNRSRTKGGRFDREAPRCA